MPAEFVVQPIDTLRIDAAASDLYKRAPIRRIDERIPAKAFERNADRGCSSFDRFALLDHEFEPRDPVRDIPADICLGQHDRQLISLGVFERGWH